ncbi:hypothetical protein HK104_001607 [Borealophlyctis nickersoniae]|nr:hypothetical protein HK104_001607 [Borealophlyctis nickersoniae]
MDLIDEDLWFDLDLLDELMGDQAQIISTSDILTQRNIPFIDPISKSFDFDYNEEAGEEFDFEEEKEEDLYNYSIDESLPLQHYPLRKFGYENRFYFVTSFLLREKLITNQQLEHLDEISLTLKEYLTTLKAKYSNLAQYLIQSMIYACIYRGLYHRFEHHVGMG